MVPAFHMLGLGDPLRGYCFRMMQNLVSHFVFVQAVDELLWYFHSRPSMESYHFPALSLASKLSCSCKGSSQLTLQNPRRTSQESTGINDSSRILELGKESRRHHRKDSGARKIYVWLHVKFAKMNMTKRLK